MIRDFLLISRKYLVLLFLFFIIFLVFKYNFGDLILRIDSSVMNYVQNYIVCNGLTNFFKIITNLGDILFFTTVIFIFILLVKDKKFFSCILVNLLITYLFSVVYKNVFRRERPIYNLIDKPTDFSFPSGHTMCSLSFFGFMIFLILKYVNNKVLKYFLVSLCVCVIALIGFSRIYLNVHFFTDVIAGAVLGIVCLIMFINYVKIKDII